MDDDVILAYGRTVALLILALLAVIVIGAGLAWAGLFAWDFNLWWEAV